MNKKGLIGNLIGTFIVVLVAVALTPTIAQEINNTVNCISDNQTIDNISSAPKGETGSFGGAGVETHFGGYDGQVVHKSFLSKYSFVQTNKSIINPDCEPITGPSKTLLGLIPAFFALSLLLIAIGIVYSALRDAGVV
jgi:hypothetical protein